VPGFFSDVPGKRAEPILEGLLADTLVSASLYVALYVFHLPGAIFTHPGWAGDFIENLHAVGIVLGLRLFRRPFCY